MTNRERFVRTLTCEKTGGQAAVSWCLPAAVWQLRLIRLKRFLPLSKRVQTLGLK